MKTSIRVLIALPAIVPASGFQQTTEKNGRFVWSEFSSRKGAFSIRKNDGNDPRVGLPRKDDSTSVYYRVVACQLDSQAPTSGLPSKIVQITKHRTAPSPLTILVSTSRGQAASTH
jgi:hypothetical protein